MAKHDVTIFHNPNCGTSRNTLALIREAGVEPEVVEYLKTGWTADQLKGLFKTMGVKPSAALRVNGTDAEAKGLTSPSATDAALIKAMAADPILVNRPIVVTPRGATLCRPVEKVVALLSDEAQAILRAKGLPTPKNQS
ncbi:MAG: arsenate reductase (glutaredoxin) [Alphaproteobacteria bacterium]